MRFSIEGLSSLKRRLDKTQVNIVNEVDGAVEQRALRMINDTKTDAPRLTGKLKLSIDLITQESASMKRVYGTNVEYARRQEYEHKTRKGFFRNNVTKHKPLLARDIDDAIKKATKR